MRTGLVGLGILLLVVWVVSFLVMKTTGFLIHLLLIVGVIALLGGFMRRVT